MDLFIKIYDENDEVIEDAWIYQDGSDSEGAAQIIDFIKDNFEVRDE